jgi:hypothetical protein
MSETEVTTEGQVDISDDLDTFTADFFGQKPAESTPTKVEVEQEQDSDAPEDGTEAQPTTADPNDDPEAEYKEAPPKKKTVQDRIDELVKQREDAKREADARIDALQKDFEAKLAALQPKPQAKANAEPSPLDLNEDGTAKYELGEFDPQYIRDLTRHTLETERVQAQKRDEEARQQRAQQEAQQALTATWNGKLEAAKAEYPDLVEKAKPLLDGFNNLDSAYAGYLSTVLMSMDKGPDVLYYLSNHPDEARQIVNSGAQKATLALGRIEAKFLEADAQKQVAKPKVSRAPEPPNVRARGTNGAYVSVAPDTDDLDAFTAEFFRRK